MVEPVDTEEEETEATESEDDLEPGEKLISAKGGPKGQDKVEASFVFDFGVNIEEAVILAGDSEVYNHYIRGATVAAQAAIRNLLASGQDPEKVSEHMANNWAPGKSVSDPASAFLASIEKMSTEERNQAILDLQKRMEGFSESE